MVNPTSEQHQLWPPVSRRENPETSQEAENAINASGSRASHCDQIYSVVEAEPGLTAGQIGVMSGYGMHITSRRLADLKNRGRVRQGQPRIWEGSGRKQVTWWPVEVID